MHIKVLQKSTKKKYSIKSSLPLTSGSLPLEAATFDNFS